MKDFQSILFYLQEETKLAERRIERRYVVEPMKCKCSKRLKLAK